MEFLWFLLIGLVAGWLAGQVMKGGGYGVIGDIVVGVIGAFGRLALPLGPVGRAGRSDRQPHRRYRRRDCLLVLAAADQEGVAFALSGAVS